MDYSVIFLLTVLGLTLLIGFVEDAPARRKRDR